MRARDGTKRWKIILRTSVGNVERAMLAHPRKSWIINTDLFATYGYGTKMSPQNQSVSLAESQRHIINPTNPCGALDDSVKDRLHVGGRPADNAQNLRGRCLMLKRLSQLGVAVLDLLEQPHVFDGDDGLISESRHEFNLLVSKGPDLRAPHCDDSKKKNILPEHWNSQDGPEAL